MCNMRSPVAIKARQHLLQIISSLFRKPLTWSFSYSPCMSSHKCTYIVHSLYFSSRHSPISPSHDTACLLYCYVFVFAGGSVVEAGSPQCTHLVVDEQTVKHITCETHPRLHVIKQEVCIISTLKNPNILHSKY